MSPNPESFLIHLREFGYNSRSDKHSNALAEAIASDLVSNCPRMRLKAANGELVYSLNFTLFAGTTDWNVDLVLGAPPLSFLRRPAPGELIVKVEPSTVQVAIELKAVMTEHHKAVKNRKRDLEAHHEHVHKYNSQAIAGGVFVINAAPEFKSSLRNTATTHSDPNRLVEHCLTELRSVAVRGGSTGYGLEARCAIVVSMENVGLKQATYVTRTPAPQVGDQLHYDAFIQTICSRYTERF